MAAREQRGRSSGAPRGFVLRARRMASRRRAAGAVLAVLVAALTAVLASASASPARAHGGSGPVAVAAFGANGGTETATQTVPGPGEAMVQTDQLPASATQATITVAPVTNINREPTFDELVDTIVTAYPQFAKANRTVKRIITCAFLSTVAATSTTENAQGEIVLSETDPTLEALTLDLCLRIVLNISTKHAPNAAASSLATCRRADRAIAMKITATGSSYRGQVNGRTHSPSRRSPVSITCQRTGAGIALTLRPSIRGRTLQQAVGPTLGIAFVNPSSKPVGVSVSFVVR